MAGSHTSSLPIVLVVEDERLVRMLALDILEDAGFTAIEAASADEAWAVLESRDDIGILFTDIDMPGSMNGYVLAARVAERWPDIRLVITSGGRHFASHDMPDNARFLSKPYVAASVLNAIDQAG